MEKVREYCCYDYDDERYLVEMLLDLDPSEVLLDDFVVPQDGVAPDDWQTAYLEQYFNEDGTQKICDLYDVPEEAMPYCRIAFFIYKVGADILKTPYGEFRLSGDRKTPPRLRNLIETEEED